MQGGHSVPIEKIVGRALFIVWPIDNVTWLGVPVRTFEKVPEPAVTAPGTSPTSIPGRTSTGTPTTSATKAAS